MAGPARIDPYKNFRFRVEIQGFQQAAFRECCGLGSRIEVIEYRDGSDTGAVRKLPGRVSHPDIVLKWGVTSSNNLYNWHRAAIQGQLQRTTGAVILLDDAGTEQVRWNFYEAWPSQWEGPTLNALGNEVAIESLTITCERQEQPESFVT